MTDKKRRCDWSDLHVDECGHCSGLTTPGGPLPPLHPPAQRIPSAQAEALQQLARLPVLTSSDTTAESMTIHDVVDELTRPHGHQERLVMQAGAQTWSSKHTTRVPSLVHQLLHSDPPASRSESGSGAKSRPNLRVEAIDTLMLIDDEAARWIARLGHDVPPDSWDHATGRPIPGSGTIATIRRVHALHAGLRPCDRPKGRIDRDTALWCCQPHRLEHDVRRWWHQARIVSGWDSPSYRPFNSCPVCQIRTGLRINLSTQTALCVECRSIWTGETIGLLAEHIRDENESSDLEEAEPA